jgi:hypothetical protein
VIDGFRVLKPTGDLIPMGDLIPTGDDTLRSVRGKRYDLIKSFRATRQHDHPVESQRAAARCRYANRHCVQQRVIDRDRKFAIEQSLLGC